jgi:hypothetical protein
MRLAVLAGLIALAAIPAVAQTYDIGEGNYSAESVDINPDAVLPVQTETEETVAPEAVPQVPTTVEPSPVYEPKKIAILQTLDKVTARTATVTVTVGQPQAVGPIFIDVKTCQKTPQDEAPEAAAFLQVWEAKPLPKTKQQKKEDQEAGQSQWVFSGWIFSSSPSLSAMNHPIYDVWLKDCVDKTN